MATPYFRRISSASISPADHRDAAAPRLHHLRVVSPHRRRGDDDVRLATFSGRVSLGDASSAGLQAVGHPANA